MSLRLPDFLPAVVHRSALMRDGGFAVYEGIADVNIRKLLLGEALTSARQATDGFVPASDREEVRGGRPARRFLNAPGGPVQEAFCKETWLLGFLRDITSPTLMPTGPLGTYSYYARPGDYLAIHRDIVSCDVAVITCLSDASEAHATGGMLCLYPDRLFEPLSAVRATPESGAQKLRLKPGQTIVMYGGIIPHALLPVSRGQARIVSVLCYRLFPAE